MTDHCPRLCWVCQGPLTARLSCTRCTKPQAQTAEAHAASQDALNRTVDKILDRRTHPRIADWTDKLRDDRRML